MTRFLSLGFLALVLYSASFVHAQSDDDEKDASHLTIKLAHGEPMLVRIYEPDEMPPKAIMIFGSGDGGWSAWEDQISIWLREEGVYVMGWDFFRYSTGESRKIKDGNYKPDDKDFDAATIGKDMATMAKVALERCGKNDLPVIYGGWSSGAVQAVPAAAWKERPKSLAGLMLFGADTRGRFGLRGALIPPTRDIAGITPTGPGTFALSDFNKAVQKLRVVQFQGTADFMASANWIRTLKSPAALYLVPRANHGFDGPAPYFQTDYLNQGVEWMLTGDDKFKVALPQPTLPFGLSPLWPISVIAVGLTLFFLFSKRHSLRLLELAMIVMALVDLSEALWSKPSIVIAWMEQFVPLGITEKSRLLLLLSGVCLLVLSRGIGRHKKSAWLLSLVMLSVTAVLHLSHAFDWHHALAAVILIVPLVRWRKEFISRSDAPSLKFAWAMALLLAFSLFGYGTVSLYQFSQHGNFGEKLSWSDCATGAADAVFLQKSRFDRDGGRVVRRFLITLRGGSLITSLLALGLLLRPVLKQRHPDATPEERERVKQIIFQHGRDPMDTFALLDDKRYFFSEDGQGVVAYALWRKFAVALADPICPIKSRGAMISNFARFCKQQDWKPLFYCSHMNNRTTYEEEGFVSFKIGEDARLDVSEFKLQGKMFQNLRTARNKAQKNGLTMQWYNAKPQVDHGLEAQLCMLSADWLKRKHGGEMTFDLGSFSLDSVHEHGISIVRNTEGRMEALATWLPYAQGKGRCLDLMRGREDARDVIDFLIVEAIDHFKAEGVTEVSLGNAPLANVDADAEGGLESKRERAVKFLFDNFDKYYGYKSLFNFKKKYQPEWQGRYIAYRPGVPLPMIGLAIAGVHLPRGFIGLLRS